LPHTKKYINCHTQEAEKKRSEIDNEALALSLSSTNAFFLFFLGKPYVYVRE